MSEPRWLKTDSLPVGEIETVARYRDASEAAVHSIAASVREIGIMLNPITVRRIRGGYRLIDGMHRLEAAKALELAEVPVRVCECTDAQAMRMEVDANLATAPLTPLDMALFLAAHKKLYEAAHPETRQGSAGGRAKNGVQTDMMSVCTFATNAAVSFGKTERHIRRLIEVGEKLPPEGVNLLRRASKRPEFGDLQVIAKCDPAERMAICEAFAKGKTTAKAALKSLNAAPGAAVKNPVRDERNRLNDIFARASTVARRGFAGDNRAELLDLLGFSEADQ
ncbi:MAG: chromosome partitioning protein ParB [Rhodobacteraceae bacterium]|nr:MAG: chromosome partitioning protein ParB [Paracoccaceae bacterium]